MVRMNKNTTHLGRERHAVSAFGIVVMREKPRKRFCTAWMRSFPYQLA